MRPYQSKGLTLINSLAGICIIVIAGLGIFALFSLTLKLLAENRSRTTAISIANEKNELIRNMPYDDIGTAAGIPSGIIPQNESVVRNGVAYNVNTQIFYVDDPFDGTLGGMTPDTLNTDYKRIKIAVSWQGVITSKPVILGTIVSPRGVENTASGGTLKILVFNADGHVVPNATVNVANNQIVPIINLTSQTDLNGILLIPGAPSSQESYEITVTKIEPGLDYSIDKTYPITPLLPVPTKPHASVIDGEVTEISFAIDILSTFNIKTIHKNYTDNFQVNTNGSFEDQILADTAIDANGNYYFVWQDYRDGSSPRIYSQKYDSAKIQQWADDLKISDPVKQVNPSIVTDGTNIYAAWNHDSAGNEDSYITKLDPSGVILWSGDRKIETVAQSSDQNNQQLAFDSTNQMVYVAFQDNRDGHWSIYLQKYDTNGIAQWNPEKKVNSDIGAADHFLPQIAVGSDGSVYAVWEDKRSGNSDIYLQKFDSGGNALWAGDKKINSDTGSINQFAPQLALDVSNNVYITWYDNRTGNNDIYLHKYNATTGAPVWSNEILITSKYPDSGQTLPTIAIGNGYIWLAWVDDRGGSNDIYAQQCDLNGTLLWEYDERINTDIGSAEQSSVRITFDPVDNLAIYTWQDNRAGDYDIYSAKYAGPGPITPIANVPINVSGQKKIYETPIIYKYDQNYTTNSDGELNLSGLEWDSYNIAIQATSSGYVIMYTEPSQPVNLAPASVSDIILNLE